jgi:uncharacterized Rmd1/YagE family protein
MSMQNNYHNVRLEWIVIWLIVVEVVVGECICKDMASGTAFCSKLLCW